MPRDWRKRNLGLLVALAVVLTLGSLFQDFRFDQSLKRERAVIAAVEREIGSMETSLADFRTAQASYLVPGQDPDFWIRRVTEISGQIEATLTRLRESAANADVRARYDAALAAVANLTSQDKKAHDYVRTDQRSLASDIVFVAGPDASQQITTELAAVRAAEEAAADGRLASISQLRFALTAFAMGLVLAVALYVGRPTRAPAVSEAATMAQMLRELPPPVKTAPPTVKATPPPPPPPAVNLPDAAELCVDLARVIDSRDVPALLERAAQVLDAKGVIIWMIDEGGSSLRPSLTHGYPEKVLTRLGTLEVNADNVTSLAFRSMRPQTMIGAVSGGSAAIAVPLMTASGCTGVLSAEVRETKPAPELLAVTKILAAQFATLIAPIDLSATRAAQA
jgi:hypothetical protein